MSASTSAVFASRAHLLNAIEQLKEQGYRDMDVMMPVPDHEIMDALPHTPTKIGWMFSLWGGIFGVSLGLLFPMWAHLFIYRQITGGKPIVSWPIFVVPGFEMMVLFTGIATLTGIILLCRLGRIWKDPHFDPRATEDHYVLIVTDTDDKVSAATDLLRTAGGEVK